eukprot:CAMPEP_0114576064 /NCGR_PEP_ID=MMETSP0125-20121206/858_1 /TAXON_ID=485358 ORGANISM="Aristerostoma sp., Strain ATCC 50986" /NCGR_SAMPLE_ID=MMETSP0125 /ASSEMBLY_ACC=CAM_ASM_000245 /LENGTH=63 /DNA_ID=CAMNT_0001764269 /DNA_START=2460 /DNA_END=2654 /DNA_ORIENTATION=+
MKATSSSIIDGFAGYNTFWEIEPIFEVDQFLNNLIVYPLGRLFTDSEIEIGNAETVFYISDDG